MSILLWFCLFPVVFYLFLKIADNLLRSRITSKPDVTYPFKQIDDFGSGLKLVCLGDSNTHGNVSFNWVKALQDKFVNWKIFNAGINADLSFTLIRRLDDVIQVNPDLITILIGTNDLNATLAESNLKRYLDRGKILPDEHPSLESFEANLEEIISELKEKTKAKIALISIPVLSEDLSSRPNIACEKFAEVIRKMARTHNLEYIPFREKQIEYLKMNPNTSVFGYAHFRMMLLVSVVFHYVFGMKYSTISRIFGNRLTPDQIHQNEISGDILVNLVSDLIEKHPV